MNSITNTLFLIAISVGLLTFTSCEKVEGCTDETALNYDAEAEEDDGSCEYEPEVEASITVESPAMHTTYGLGDTIHIKALIKSNMEMHGYEVMLVNTSTDEHVMHNSEHAHGNSIEVDEVWINNVEGHSDMELTITAEIDHDGMEVTETVSFHCHPM